MQYDIARLLSPETARRLESKFAIDLNGVQLPIHRSRIVLRRIAEAIKVDIFLLRHDNEVVFTGPLEPPVPISVSGSYMLRTRLTKRALTTPLPPFP
jgi:hypothetical protein